MKLYSKMVHPPCQLFNQISCINSYLLKHPLRQPQISNISEKEEKNTKLNTQIAQNLSETQESTFFSTHFNTLATQKNPTWLVHDSYNILKKSTNNQGPCVTSRPEKKNMDKLPGIFPG